MTSERTDAFLEDLSQREPLPFDRIPSAHLPRKRMTTSEFELLARCLGVPEADLREQEALAWAESVKRGLVGGEV